MTTSQDSVGQLGNPRMKGEEFKPGNKTPASDKVAPQEGRNQLLGTRSEGLEKYSRRSGPCDPVMSELYGLRASLPGLRGVPSHLGRDPSPI